MRFKFFLISGVLAVLCFNKATAQQNHSLFLMHQLPESNLLNPAVPISCKWYIGLPFVSSLHLNYANSSFSYKQLFNTTSDGNKEIDADGIISRLHWRNYLGLEFHSQLLGVGYRQNDYSFMFTITEKINLPFIYPKEPFLLLWNGNSQFEGEAAGFKGTGIYATHYREYAISASKYTQNNTYLGIRGKLLFGKMNISTRSSDISLNTNETSFDLLFKGDLNIRSSAPIIIDTNENQIENIQYNDNTNLSSYLLNRKNPGFALDFGIIYPFNNKIKLSASIIDLGFIRWRSNLNTINGSGEFSYDGPLGDSAATKNYSDELLNSFMDSLNFQVSDKKYTSFLSPRVIVGGSYRFNSKLYAGAQTEATIVGSKLIPSATISTQYMPYESITLMASYSIQYYSIKSLGAGFIIGKNPVQFYMISDDVLGAIWPLRARNINLRFGLNINLGCNIKEKHPEGKGMLKGRCYWLEKDIKRKKNRVLNKKY